MLAASDPSDTGMRTTLAVFVGAALLAAPLPALRCQAPDAQALLARVRVIEEQEGDLRSAEREYRALLDSKDASAVHAEASLRLGRMLWRLDKKDEGKPFLERAVAAGGAVAAEATAVLQGKGPDGKQAQEIAAKAKDAIDRLASETQLAGDPRADLVWLGAAAMPTIVRELEVCRKEVVGNVTFSLSTAADTTLHVVGVAPGASSVTAEQAKVFSRGRQSNRLCSLVWSIGGEEAERWLRAAVADGDVQWRRIVAMSADGAKENLLAIVELELADPDPNGYVPALALKQSGRLPIERVMPLLANPVAYVREAARMALEQRAEWAVTGSADQAMRVFEPYLAKALADSDPQVSRQAFQFLGDIAARSQLATQLYLDWLPRAPVIGPVNIAPVPLAALLVTARALGPVNPADGRNDRRAVLLPAIQRASQQDPARTAADICELAEMGYERLRSGYAILNVAVELAHGDDELLRIAKLLPVCVAPGNVANVLCQHDLPAAAAEPIRRRLDAVLGGGVDRPTPGGQRSGRGGGRGNPVATIEGQEPYYLLICLGRTGAASIIPFLRATVDQRPEFLTSVVEAALRLSRRNADGEVSLLLRDLMIREDLTARFRNSLFAELARRGDAAAIPLFTRAYELGLAETSREGEQSQRVGVQWLMTSHENQREQKLHGFDDAQLAAAWRAVLAGPAAVQVLSDSYPIFRGGPAVARLPIAEAVLAHIDHLANAKVDTRNTNNAWQQNLLNQVANIVTDTTADAPYRTIVAKLCAHPTWGSTVMNGLNAPAVITAMADDLRKLLGGPNSFEAMRCLNRGGITLTKDELLTCLRNQQNRLAFVNELRPDSPPEIVQEVVGMLKASGDQMLRKAACEALGRFLTADSVPALLPMLRDPDAEVVKAATESLQKIRLYHEQRAYWDQFAQGITTGRDAATSKLLIQAKPGAPKEQRLLALRSLAALGAPEALPYLIEWAQDADAEVAQAARDAITKIHQQAGVK
jgi:hypothetical protein